MTYRPNTRSHTRRTTRPRRRSGFTLIEAALTTVIVGTGVLAIVAAQQAYHRKNQWAQLSGEAMLLANELREMTLAMPIEEPFVVEAVGPEAGEGGFDSAGDPVADEATDFPVIFNYNDVLDLVGTVTANVSEREFNPPIDANQEVLGRDRVAGPNMVGGDELNPWLNWTQRITLERVPEDFVGGPGGGIALDGAGLMRVTATMIYDNGDGPQTITELTWLLQDD